MAETLGRATPRLVVVGRRGWENENIIDLLERSQRLGPYVAEVGDITDQGLASLMAGASALIAPRTRKALACRSSRRWRSARR